MTIWTVENGLPQNTIQALLQTHDGFIWIGTPSGLVRFDGLNFKTYNRWNIQAIKNDNITSLYEDQNHVLWVGTEGGGLCALQNSTWSNYSTDNGLSSNEVRAITSDFQGNLWVGTDYGLNRINKDGIRIYTEKNGLYDNTITALTIDSWNNLWIGTFRGGLAKFNQGKISVLGYQEGLKNLSVRTLCMGERGILWIGTREGIYYIKRDDGFVHHVRGTSYMPINAFLNKASEKLWIGTMVGGVKEMNLTDLNRKSITNNLPDDFIQCMIEDNAGNIWLGTDVGGLVQLSIRRIRKLMDVKIFSDVAVSALHQDRNESILVGTRNKGLFQIRDNNIVSVLTISSGLSSNTINVIYEDVKGLIWIGTDDKGINILDNLRVSSKMSTEDGLVSNRIKTIVQDYKKRVWIGTDAGLNMFKDGKLTHIHQDSNIIDTEINCMLESGSNKLYIGTKKGVYQIDEDSFLPLGADWPAGFEVISLFDDNEVLWIGSNGLGLFRWYEGRLDRITKEHGLIDNYILSIAKDKKNNLWMSSHSGVFWVKSRDLNNFIEKRINRVHSTWYDEDEGMPSRQCVGDGQPRVLRTINGTWLYPTIKGVSLIDPNILMDYCTTPRNKIEIVLSGADTITVDRTHVPQLSGYMLSINFTDTEFSAPHKIRFKYQLEGPENKTGYIDPGEERKVTFHDLEFGDHTFSLATANNEGKWSDQEARFMFSVLPPFYFRPEYLSIFFGITLVISSLIIYINHNRKKQKRQDKYKTSRRNSTRIKEIVSDLEKLMTGEKLFLDPDLTLADLASRLKIHYNYISRIINEQFEMSYNDFINKYRIEEVKLRLLDPGYKDKTVLEIMYETGFYSKSVFNTAFKKFTGMTPSQFREKKQGP